MRKNHIKDVELLQYLHGTLTDKKLGIIKDHLDQCNECKKRYELLANLVKPVSQAEEKQINPGEIDSLYESFIKTKLDPNKPQIQRKKFILRPAFSLAFGCILILLGIGLFFLLSPLSKQIIINNYTKKHIIINDQPYKLSELHYLPKNKIIITKSTLDITIKNNANIILYQDVKFNVSKKETYLFALLNGKIDVETIKEKQIEIKINQFIIKPIGTKFNVQYRNDILKVLLLEGKLEIINLDNNKRFLLSFPKNNTFIYNFKKIKTDIKADKKNNIEKKSNFW